MAMAAKAMRMCLAAVLTIMQFRSRRVLCLTLFETQDLCPYGFVTVIRFISSAPRHWLGCVTESPGFAAKAAPTGFASGAIFVGAVSTANGVNRAVVTAKPKSGGCY